MKRRGSNNKYNTDVYMDYYIYNFYYILPFLPPNWNCHDTKTPISQMNSVNKFETSSNNML